ncbi:MAG: FAD-binding oxidoreductase [Rhizobiales bacterium]|nr:FAD-binding oxidoreductase [Hyphomicrobiales bacterium]
MSQTSAPRPPAHDAMVPERSAAGPKRIIDCDVCVVGGDVAGLFLAGDLARRGRDVVLLAMAGPSVAVPSWPLDSVIAPGFPLSTLDLSSRVGRDDAQELLILSAQAAEAGLGLIERLGIEIGPRGRLTVARAHAAEDLYREHELRQELAPDTTVFVGAEDLAALLGTQTFAAGLGVVPAERVRTASLIAALEDAARAAGVRFVSVESALSVDLKGVRKYFDMANQRVRAFQVAVCGPAAFARLGSGVARLPRAPWVSGGFRLPGSNAPYAGLVEEFGLTGLAYHFDGDRLAVAAQSALPVMTRVGAARVLRRHAAEVYPVGGGLVEGGTQAAVAPLVHRLHVAAPAQQLYWCVRECGRARWNIYKAREYVRDVRLVGGTQLDVAALAAKGAERQLWQVAGAHGEHIQATRVRVCQEVILWVRCSCRLRNRPNAKGRRGAWCTSRRCLRG